MEATKTFEELKTGIKGALAFADGDWVAEIASEMLLYEVSYDGDSVWLHNGEKVDFDELMDSVFETLSKADGEYIASFYTKVCGAEATYDGDWVWVAA